MQMSTLSTNNLGNNHFGQKYQKQIQYQKSPHILGNL